MFSPETPNPDYGLDSVYSPKTPESNCSEHVVLRYLKHQSAMEKQKLTVKDQRTFWDTVSTPKKRELDGYEPSRGQEARLAKARAKMGVTMEWIECRDLKIKKAHEKQKENPQKPPGVWEETDKAPGGRYYRVYGFPPISQSYLAALNDPRDKIAGEFCQECEQIPCVMLAYRDLVTSRCESEVRKDNNIHPSKLAAMSRRKFYKQYCALTGSIFPEASYKGCPECIMSGASAVSKQARDKVLGKNHKRARKSLPSQKELPKDKGFVTANDIAHRPARVSLEPDGPAAKPVPTRGSSTTRRNGPALCRREVCKALARAGLFLLGV